MRAAGAFDWRGEGESGGGGGGDKKKKKVTPHWAKAKALGAKKKGSEGRKRRREKEQKKREEEGRATAARVVEEEEEEEQLSERARVQRQRVTACALPTLTVQQQHSFLQTLGAALPLTALCDTQQQHKQQQLLAPAAVRCAFDAAFDKTWSAAIALKRRKTDDDKEQQQQQLGCPRVLLLAASADRCVVLVNDMRAVLPTGAPPVTKLWARHISMEEHRKLLNEVPVSLGVGTPARLQALFDEGTLKTNELQLLVIDCQAQATGFNVLMMNDTKDHVLGLLNRLSKRFEEGKCKLLFI